MTLDAARKTAATAAAEMTAAANDITRTAHPGWLPVGPLYWTGTKLPYHAVVEAKDLLAKILEREQTTGQFHLDDPDLRKGAERLVEAVTKLDNAEKEITRLAPATLASVKRSQIYGLSMHSILDTVITPIQISAAKTPLGKDLAGVLKHLEELRVALKELFDQECISRYGDGNNVQYKQAVRKFETTLADIRSRSEFSDEARAAMWEAGVKDLRMGAWIAVKGLPEKTYQLPILDHPMGSLAGVERLFKHTDIFIDIAKTALIKEGAKITDKNTVHPWM